MGKENLVKCFGLNQNGQTDVPSAFEGGADIIALGAHHTCMGKENLVKCFGDNNSGKTMLPTQYE